MKHTYSLMKDNKKFVTNFNMFPEGIMIDPVSRQYRTNKIQSLLSYIACLTVNTEGQKKDSPIKNTDESSLVDNSFEISNISFTSGDLLNIIKSINFIFEIDLE